MLSVKSERLDIDSSSSLYVTQNLKSEPDCQSDSSNHSLQPCTSKSLNKNVKKEFTPSETKIKSEIINKPHEQCPICLSLMKSQLLARPIDCKHNFCLECIEEWSRVSSFYLKYYFLLI
jgi:hypothetical protein